ncbi:hypothetical protein BpHYR1_019254 [Brachionus plicatilis]|uniref:Uncharacterized protein n=1 Tax=Brachionus plicatilis TaxID=10195 RepID=A0A3M7PE93_BRAPC|nr:hypothetical protein BpHYR1_019254 [Brachionus plicatilis]
MQIYETRGNSYKLRREILIVLIKSDLARKQVILFANFLVIKKIIVATCKNNLKTLNYDNLFIYKIFFLITNTNTNIFNFLDSICKSTTFHDSKLNINFYFFNKNKLKNQNQKIEENEASLRSD